MGSIHSSVMRKSNVRSKLNFSTILLVFFGFLIGISFATVIFTKHYLFPSTTRLSSSIDAGIITGNKSYRTIHDFISASLSDIKYSHALGSDGRSKIHVATNPRGAESLTPGIVVSETDFYLHRLWGDPNEDLKTRPKYLVTFAVGFAQRDNINAAIQKFSDEFTILLFHYDGLTSEWDQFEWSKHAIHVSARGQTKWWYAKRFLHPDIVAAYDYIFIWDEDLGVENFNAEE
ncbi:hypothetical protein MRB53_015961 [Persea americana]|uniref:Uncharacterized protein n=1 Tax=Persea americana TaxID=3435 RepID=A0ACC2M0K2_PERAE|nr:hypothetical protein MRB53_015961 [Persea americana]